MKTGDVVQFKSDSPDLIIEEIFHGSKHDLYLKGIENYKEIK